MDDQARYLDAMRRFSGDARMVAQVFASLSQRGVTPTADHWQLLLDAHIGSGDVDAAETTLSQMAAAGVTVSDTQLFDLGVTFFRRGETARAIAQFDGLHQRGARPGARHAPAVFNAFLQAQRFPAARAVLRDMAQRGETVPRESYTQLLRDALKRRAVKDTEALLATMLTAGVTPEQSLASELAIMVCQAADPDRAGKLVAQLLDAGVTFTSSVYATILRAHIGQKNYAGIVDWIAVLTQHRIALSSYGFNALLSARLATGDTDGAWDALCRLWDEGMLASSENLSATITQNLAGRQPRRAQAALTAMIFTATPVTGEEMHAVIAAQLAADNVADAVAVVRDALAGSVTFDRRVLRDITQALLARGALRETLLLLADARHAGVVSARSYGQVLTFVLRHKRADRGVHLIAHYGKERIRLNVTDASQAIRGLARDGSREQAVAAVNAFAAQKVYADEPTYRELLWECARAGDTTATRTVYDLLEAAGHPREESHDKALAWATGQTPRRLDAPAELPQTPVTPPVTTTAESSASNDNLPAFAPDSPAAPQLDAPDEASQTPAKQPVVTTPAEPPASNENLPALAPDSTEAPHNA